MKPRGLDPEVLHTSHGSNNLQIDIESEEVNLEEGIAVLEYYESDDRLMLLTYGGGEVAFDPDEGVLGLGGDYGITINLPEEFAAEIERKVINSIAEKHF